MGDQKRCYHFDNKNATPQTGLKVTWMFLHTSSIFLWIWEIWEINKLVRETGRYCDVICTSKILYMYLGETREVVTYPGWRKASFCTVETWRHLNEWSSNQLHLDLQHIVEELYLRQSFGKKSTKRFFSCNTTIVNKNSWTRHHTYSCSPSWSVCLSVCWLACLLSVCLSAPCSVCLSVCLSVCWLVGLLVHLLVGWFVCLSVCPLFCLSVFLFVGCLVSWSICWLVGWFVCLSVILSLCWLACWSVCTSICFFSFCHDSYYMFNTSFKLSW